MDETISKRREELKIRMLEIGCKFKGIDAIRKRDVYESEDCIDLFVDWDGILERSLGKVVETSLNVLKSIRMKRVAS